MAGSYKLELRSEENPDKFKFVHHGSHINCNQNFRGEKSGSARCGFKVHSHMYYNLSHGFGRGTGNRFESSHLKVEAEME
jgi:hypothetical protein